MDIEEQIRQKVERDRLMDEAGAKAVFEPLPGPLRDIFSLEPDITVPETAYKIRPFYDIDFEWLTLLNHPLSKMMTETGGKPAANLTYLPRGPHAWQLAWIMTHTVDEADKLLEKGQGALVKEAKHQFATSQMQVLAKIHVAIMEQLSIYFSGMIAYGEKPKEGEKSHPPSGAHSTVLGGS